MNRNVRIVLAGVLLLIGLISGWRFKADFDRSTDERRTRQEAEEDSGETAVAPIRHHMGLWGAACLLAILSGGALAAYEFVHAVGSRAAATLMAVDEEGESSPDYDKAEEAWARGEHLEAIGLLREYLQANPRRVHAAIRIAEIYEKDLRNPLAAALEYEEVLRQPISSERWARTAIHLHNIYSGQLGQPEKGIALLQRIVTEHPRTKGGAKAHARLSRLAEDGIVPAPAPLPTDESPQDDEPEAADEAPPEPPSHGLPPGFRPK